MRIDRSRIRIASRIEQAGVGVVGLVIGFGTHRFESWPNSAYTEASLAAWADGRAADPDEVLGWIEKQILVEELPKWSAHQRIAMIRDGLLIPAVPHPGS